MQMGFDAFFFARADYQDIIKRRKDRTMEVIWRGSKSLGASAQVGFGGIAHIVRYPRSINSSVQQSVVLHPSNEGKAFLVLGFCYLRGLNS